VPFELTDDDLPAAAWGRNATIAPSFSWTWVGISLAVFISLQIVLGYFAGRYVLAHYFSEGLLFAVAGSLGLGSYFLGGLLIGVVSPRVRMLEPVVGALLAVLATIAVGLLTPALGLKSGKLVLGGMLAFLMAVWGAKLGDKLTR
jgi:hypothetical protein